jgi:hypothetical protein
VAVEMSWLGRLVSNSMTKSASATPREPHGTSESGQPE